ERAFMAIDAATRAALEIERATRGGREGSLLAAIDHTITAPGGRLLAERLGRPLTDRAAILRRLDAVELVLSDRARLHRVRQDLRAAGDLARALTRLMLGRGGPRDLAQLRDGLKAGDRAAGCVGGGADAPAEIAAAAAALTLAAHAGAA